MICLAEIHADVERSPEDQNIEFDAVNGGTLATLLKLGVPIEKALIIFYNNADKEARSAPLAAQYPNIQMSFDAGGDGFDKRSLLQLFSDLPKIINIIVTGSHYGACHTVLLLRLEDYFKKVLANDKNISLTYHLPLPLIGSKFGDISQKIPSQKEVNMSYFPGVFYLDGKPVNESKTKTQYKFWTTLKALIADIQASANLHSSISKL